MHQRIFTTRERRGLLLMAGIFLALTAFRMYYSPEPPQPDPDIISLLRRIDSTRHDQDGPEKEFNLPIDLNEVSAETLIRAGIPRVLSYRLIKYRDAYGPLTGRGRLEKIYGMTDSLLTILDSISIPLPQTGVQANAGTVSDNERTRSTEDAGHPFTKKSETRTRSRPPEKELALRVGINGADTMQWRKLYGIGPVLSDRIVKFREYLGGFHSVEQVSETYGLPPETFASIRPLLYLDKPHRKIRLSDATIEELSSHPYLKYDEARKIYAYIQQHRPIASMEDLRPMIAVPYEKLEKIAPYLQFDAIEDSVKVKGTAGN